MRRNARLAPVRTSLAQTVRAPIQLLNGRRAPQTAPRRFSPADFAPQLPHAAIPAAAPYGLPDRYGLAGTEPERRPSPFLASDGTQTVLPSASPSTRTSTP